MIKTENPFEGLRSIEVNLGERSYPIHIGYGVLRRTGRLLLMALPRAGKSTVITHKTIFSLHGDSLKGGLEDVGVRTQVITVPEGDVSKSWGTAGRLFGALIDFDMDRSSVILAFGGGVIGDLAGFMAATYLRGVSLVQIPSTLLAQVDSGIGGKTALNHPKGKNLIGAFYQPKMAIVDPHLLETLSMREFRAGLAEVVKYGVIADGELFNLLERNVEGVLGRVPELLLEVIVRCCAIKARLVELDERDNRGLRVKLNYGHTVGHALEIVTDLDMRHGEAVAIGITLASEISHRLGLMGEDDLRRQVALLRLFGLPTQLPLTDVQTLLGLMHRDKKARGGVIRFVLPTGIGREPVVEAVSDGFLAEVLESAMGRRGDG